MSNYTVTMVKYTYYDLEINADSEDEVKEKAFDAYYSAVDEGTIDEYFMDSDVDVDMVNKNEE